MNYNSKSWRTFRRIVPFKVRWILGIPLFCLWCVAGFLTVSARSLLFFWRELRDEIADKIRQYPSFWGDE